MLPTAAVTLKDMNCFDVVLCTVLYITGQIIVVLHTCVRDACSSNLGHVARCTYRSFALIYPLS
jgi:hypothetical protein